MNRGSLLRGRGRSIIQTYSGKGTKQWVPIRRQNEFSHIVACKAHRIKGKIGAQENAHSKKTWVYIDNTKSSNCLDLICFLRDKRRTPVGGPQYLLARCCSK